MEDKTGSLERLRTLLSNAEKADMTSVKAGDIIYVPLDENDGHTLKGGYRERTKYIVIIGFTPEDTAVGALLINSNIDPSKRSQEFMNCQYQLMKRNYRAILDYDSWLDCSEIFELSRSKIKEREGRMKGHLMQNDLDRVFQFLKETDVIDTATKRRFGIVK